jgi:trans-2,3-dihydro-3-hydroxyanthranilate isomerase
MQAIAVEFGLSETAFVLPPTVAAADYRLRIFTPRTELVFAGHPSVGSAWVLAQAGLIAAGSVVQECAAGLIGVQVDEAGAQVDGGVPVVGPRLDGAALAAAVGLVPGELDNEFAAGVAAAGAPFAFLPVFAPAVARAVPDPVRLRAVVPDPLGLTVLAFDGGARRAHVRMFRPGSRAGEDPATGSAAVALAVFLEPAESTAEGEPGDSGEGDDAERGGEPVLLRAPVKLAEQQACSRAGGALGGVDQHGLHRGQVQDQAVVAYGVAGDVVAAALDRQGQVVVAGVGDPALDVGRVVAAQDGQRSAVDHRVEHDAG